MLVDRFRKFLRNFLRYLICNLKHIRLYSRLMICYTVIFLVVAYTFAFVAARYYIQYITVKQLEQSRNALNGVCNYYELKQTELANIILPLYQTDKNNFYLNNMLKSETDEECKDPLNKMQIFKVLEEIAERDGDIEEIYI